MEEAASTTVGFSLTFLSSPNTGFDCLTLSLELTSCAGWDSLTSGKGQIIATSHDRFPQMVV